MEVLKDSWKTTLGVKDVSCLSPSSVLEKAGLNWDVEKRPLFVGEPVNVWDEEGVTPTTRPTNQKVEKYVATYRSDNQDILGIVSPQYEVFQNSELAELAWAIESEGAGQLETAGMFRNGRDVFMMMKNSTFRLPGEDEVDTYHFFYNSHDGSRTVTVMPTTIRVWCTNTQNAVLRQSNKGMKFHHSSKLRDNIADALEILKLSDSRTEEFRVRCEALAKTRIEENSSKVHSFFKNVYHAAVEPLPVKSFGECDEDEKSRIMKSDDVISEWYVNLGHERNRMKGDDLSLWNLFNAMTEWVDHDRGTNRGRHMKAINRFRSNILGTNAKIKSKMFAETAALV